MFTALDSTRLTAMRTQVVLLLALALTACKAPPVRVDKRKGFDGAWDAGRDEESRVHLESYGTEVRLAFRGRRFVFKNLPAFKGSISEDEVHLRGSGIDIQINEKTVIVMHTQGRDLTEIPLANFPTARTAIYVNKAWVYR